MSVVENMIRILFFIESLSGGGAEKVLTDIIKRLDKTLFDITVVTVVDIGVYREEVIKHCRYTSLLKLPNEESSWIKKFIYRLKYKMIYTLPSSWIYKIYIKKEYDVEVGFVEGFSTKFISNSSNEFSRKIAWVHVDPINLSYADNYYRNIQEQIECYLRFNKIVCVSHATKNAFEKKFEITNNVIVRHNPINNIEIIQKSKEKIEITKPENKILIGSIGRLTSEKGYLRLLKGLKRLADEGFEFELWILGEGKQRAELEHYIFENGLINSVKLLGFEKNPYKFVKLFDLFVCSSISEGYSLAMAESMVLGLPIFSTNCAGPVELLKNGDYGIIVNNNEESIYMGLRKVLLNRSLLTCYREKTIERREIFKINKSINAIEKIFFIGD